MHKLYHRGSEEALVDLISRFWEAGFSTAVLEGEENGRSSIACEFTCQEEKGKWEEAETVRDRVSLVTGGTRSL